MRLGVMFNCQHAGLRRSLQALLPDASVISFGTPDLERNPDSRAAALNALRQCDTVVWMSTLPKHGPVDRALLTDHVKHIVRVPPAIFGGFHPDTCFVNAAIRGPTNALHSRIAISAYLAGLDVEDTANLYNKLSFARLGYFSYFAAHRTLMLDNFRRYDMDLSAAFERWLERGCFMYSLNHPKIAVLFDIARLICDRIGVTPDPSAQSPDDDLHNKPSHPVYTDLADAFGVAPETCFRTPAVAGRASVELSLPEFLERSFRIYKKHRRAPLAQVDGVREALAALDLL